VISIPQYSTKSAIAAGLLKIMIIIRLIIFGVDRL
jgi:hypothetical protein